MLVSAAYFGELQPALRAWPIGEPRKEGRKDLPSRNGSTILVMGGRILRVPSFGTSWGTSISLDSGLLYWASSPVSSRPSLASLSSHFPRLLLLSLIILATVAAVVFLIVVITAVIISTAADT